LQTPPLPAPVSALLLLLLALSSAGLPLRAAPLPGGELEQRCWNRYTRERTRIDLREPTAVNFSNLRDGYVVASPLLVEFAVRGMGVAPAGVKLAGTGHHHILVDKTLSTKLGQPIPFDDQHRHFGKGQTATLLDLPAGPHTLRLLFADDEHRPYFVFSREITVQVRGPRSNNPRPRIEAAKFDATCAAWYQDEVSRPRPPDEPLYAANLRADEPLSSPFNIRLGVDGFGVCARGGVAPKTGHFVIDVLDGARNLQRTVDLSNGATQANLSLANGVHRLRLRFVDNNGADLLPAHELPIRVVAQDRI
jgi:hypothetical protein